MNVLIIYAHPEERSFTAALKDRAVQVLENVGHHVEVTDLYADGFNPVAGRHDFKTVLDPERFHYQAEQEYASEQGGFSDELACEQKKLENADLVIFAFPLWWGGVPAILKGWIDRVLAYGFAYVDGHRYESGLFKGRRGILCVSTGGTQRRFTSPADGGTYGDIEQVLYPTNHCVIKYFGLTQLDPFVAYAAPRLSATERGEILDNWERRLIEIVSDTNFQKVKVEKPNLRLKKQSNGWAINR